jgi:hypothetical protein
MNFHKQFSFNQVFMPKMRCDLVYLGNFCIFLCGNTERPLTPTPPPPPPIATVKLELLARCWPWTSDKGTKVGKVPTIRASDTDTDLPTVSTDLFSEFQYLKNRFIASK